MSTVALGDDLGIETSTELKTRLAPLVDQGGDLTLDASQVGRIHTASVQVLCAFVEPRAQDGQPPALRRLHGHLPRCRAPARCHPGPGPGRNP